MPPTALRLKQEPPPACPSPAGIPAGIYFFCKKIIKPYCGKEKQHIIRLSHRIKYDAPKQQCSISIFFWCYIINGKECREKSEKKFQTGKYYHIYQSCSFVIYFQSCNVSILPSNHMNLNRNPLINSFSPGSETTFRKSYISTLFFCPDDFLHVSLL